MGLVEDSLQQELQLFKQEYDRGGMWLSVTSGQTHTYCMYLTMQFKENAHAKGQNRKGRRNNSELLLLNDNDITNVVHFISWKSNTYYPSWLYIVTDVINDWNVWRELYLNYAWALLNYTDNFQSESQLCILLKCESSKLWCQCQWSTKIEVVSTESESQLADNPGTETHKNTHLSGSPLQQLSSASGHC